MAGNEDALALWKTFRELSVTEYVKLYERLNVAFDVYGGESLVSKHSIRAVMDDLGKRGLLTGKAANEGGKWKKGKEKAEATLNASDALDDDDDLETSQDGPLAQAVDLTAYKLDKPVLQKPGE